MSDAQELPLISETLRRPFWGGREVFALYHDCLIVTTMKGGRDLPQDVCAFDGASAWFKCSRATKVTTVAMNDVSLIETHEQADRVRVKLSANTGVVVVELPLEFGVAVRQLFVERMGEKLVSRAECARDARRALVWGVIIAGLVADVLAVSMVLDLRDGQQVTGPAIMTGIVVAIYESNGYPTAAACTLGGALAFNLMLIAISFATPPEKARLLNCAECGYDVRGLTGQRCAECGARLPTVRGSALQKRR